MVTIKDIAKQAGVSYSTVSKALLDSPLVKPNTKKRIIAIAQEMGYQPNMAARSLVSKKTGAIGMIWPSVERTALSSLITGLNQAFEDAGFTTLLSMSRPESALETFHRYRVDAILIFGDRDDSGQSEYIAFSEKSAIPIIVYGAAGTHPCSTVDVNRGQAIRLALRHLVELGHRHIAYIGEPDYEDPMQTVKIEAFLDEASQLGLSAGRENILPLNGLKFHDGFLAARTMLDWDSPPTAVISGGVDLTEGILRASSERGLRVPEDLAVVSYDNLPQMEEMEVPMTVVGVAISTIISVIADTVIDLIDQPGAVKNVFLEPELVVRASTGLRGGHG